MSFNPVVVTAPTEQPAVCYLTGSSVGPFIDTGLYAEDKITGRKFGRIYLCKDIVLALAAMFDEKPTPAQERASYSRGFLDGVNSELGPDLARTADGLRRYLDHVGAVVDSAGDQ
jgi:hypothetical protein